MAGQDIFGGPVVLIVDEFEFRRALIVDFLKDWAAAEKVDLVAHTQNAAHAWLREGFDCKLIVFNAGGKSCSSTDAIAEIKVLRALSPATSLVVLAESDDPAGVLAVMQSGADGYLSEGTAPTLVLRALSFLLQGGTYFPRSALSQSPFRHENPLSDLTVWDSPQTGSDLEGSTTPSQ